MSYAQWMRMATSALLAGWLVGISVPVATQDSLSTQVLRLLNRESSWTALQTFTASIALSDAVPATTTNKLYQTGGALFWNGSQVTTAAGVGTVTSVGLATPAIFLVSGSPVTGSGTLTFGLVPQATNLVWAGPTSGSDANPTFRSLVDADIPNALTITGANSVDWGAVNKTGSSLADLITRSASDLSTGTLPDARFPATLPAISGANLTNLNATNLASGTLPAARFPAFTGDITTAAGAVATTLASTGVVAGAYITPNITVDAKGRITAIASAAAGAHTFLSATHTDTLAGAVTRGAVIVGNSTPAWARLQPTVAGQVLQYDGTDSLWTTLSLAASSITSGTLGVTRGGTGIASAAANGQVLIGTGAGYALSTLTGTANQIIVTNGSGTITLSTPQSIGTTSTPQFAKLALGTGAHASALLYLSGGTHSALINDNGNCGAADTFNLALGNIQKTTLDNNCVISFSNPTAGTIYVIQVVQDGTGSRTVTWPTILWNGAGAPTLSTGAADVDLIWLFYDGTSYYGWSTLGHD
jgi:hypothetical protein